VNTASTRSLTGLKWLLLANVAGSILHYVHNLLFFAHYPEPSWINRSMVDAFWFFMTPLAWLGYRLIQRNRIGRGAGVLMGYAACNLLSLGHYLYAPLHDIEPVIHAFILLEAGLALVLVGWVGVMFSGSGARGRAEPGQVGVR